MSMIAAVQESGVTFGDFIAGIPHDGPSVLVYALVVAFGALVLWGSRKSRRSGGGPPPSGTA